MTNPEKDRVQSIRKGLQIIRTLARYPGLTPTELARRLGMNRATVYRLLWTLQEERAVVQVTGGAFSLGPLFLDLSLTRTWEHALINLSLPALVQLRNLTRETAGLYLARSTSVVCAEIQAGSYEIRRTTRPGDEMPIPKGATAKCYLAWRILEVPEPEALLVSLGISRAEVPSLMGLLAEIRNRGWALSWEEWVPGGCAVAAPVLDEAGQIRAVITLSGPTSRITRERASAYTAAVCQTAAAIRELLCQWQSPTPDTAGQLPGRRVRAGANPAFRT